ncbi:MAG: alpha/beta hydrolase [Candidatus Pacebacteria bacterium]|nr:alpha/beta hydrolase [Candidatus Paceibacterota bacterium]
MKQQIILIGGAMAFHTYDDYIHFLKTMDVSLEYLKKKRWKHVLQERLGDEYDVNLLDMPCGLNAKYNEWKIYFERFIPLFNDEVILIGYSQGGIFLAKYLAKNDFSKKIKALYLLAAPSGDTPDEVIGDFTFPVKLRTDIQTYLLQSEDDPIVPASQVLKYKELLPDAELIMFKDKGHFSSAEFPELVELIKRL